MTTNRSVHSALAFSLAVCAAVAADAPPSSSDAQSKTNATPTKLPEVTVREKRDDPTAYAVPEATTATKMDTPIHDVPQSIEVRTRQLLDDLGGQQRVDAVARTVAGVRAAGEGNGGSNIPFLTLRGFPNYGEILRDGYFRNGGYYNVMDLANVERVEFLKGPASMLYGSTYSLGGLVNYISKRPEPTRRLDVDFTAGSFDFYRGTVDVGGPLTTNQSVLYRINGAYEQGESFRDFGDHRTAYVAPELSFQISPNDRITVLTDYLNMTGQPDFGLPLAPESLNVPVTKYFQEPTWDDQRFHAFNANVEYVHDFSEDWHLTAGYSYDAGRWWQNYTYIYLADPSSTLVSRDANYERIFTDEHDGELRLGGKFDTGNINHQLLVGFSARSEVFDSTGYYGNLPSFGLFDTPIYGASPTNVSPASPGIYEMEVFAPYVQDLITLLPQVKVLLGGRYDIISQRSYFDDGAGTVTDQRQNDKHFSPRAGIVFQPWKPTSLYFGYGSSFIPQIGKSKTGQIFDPELGELLEVGVKQELNDRLNANLSVYRLTKQNALTSDPTDPTFSVQTGEQRSRGVELDVNGKVTEDLRVTLAYAFSKAEITKDNYFPPGTELLNVPRHSVNLFGVYSFQKVLKGLEVGAGVYYATTTQASQPNTFLVPEVFQLDAMVGYQANRHLRLQVNLENLSDRQNYSSDGGFLRPSRPLSATGKVSYSF